MSRASATDLPSARGPKATLSSTLIQVKSAPCWKTTPRSGPGAVMSLPSSVARPVVGVSKPATMLSSVLLPQPDGPTRVTNSPAPIARSIGSSACTPSAVAPKRLDTPSTTSFAVTRRDGAASATDSMVIRTCRGRMNSALRTPTVGRDSQVRIHSHAAPRHYTILARQDETTNGAQLGGIVENCSAAFRNSAYDLKVRRTPVSFAPGIPIHFSLASSFT